MPASWARSPSMNKERVSQSLVARAPVAFIPVIGTAAPAPVAGSPKQTGFGGHHPRAWHPKVAVIPIRPVAGRPQITIGGGHRLLVYRQCWRSDRDRNAELRE